MIDNILLIGWLTFILYSWLDTEAAIEWGSLLRIKFLKYKEFGDMRKSSFKNLSYCDFLLMKHNNFFTRLITCPYCLGFWLTALAFGVFHKEVGGFKYLPVDVIALWISYSVLRWTLKKLNE